MNTITNNHPSRAIRRALPFVAAIALALTAGPASADTWRWSVTPYAWLTDVGVKAEVDDRTVVDETISVGDLIKDLETIFQMKLEGSNGRYGILTDVFDVTLADDANGLALPHGAGTANLESEMGMTVLDFAATFDPDGDRRGLSLLAGTRIVNERATVDASMAMTDGTQQVRTFDMDDTTVDVLMGVRFSQRLSKHFGFTTQADLSAGGTDYTWSLAPSLTYAFGRYGQYGLNAGYRTMTVNFQDENGLDPQMTMSGFLSGFRISF